MKPKQTPTKEGLYWARASVDDWFNLIVSVQGEAPMLQIAWALRLSGLDAPKLIKPAPSEIDEWDLNIIEAPHIKKG